MTITVKEIVVDYLKTNGSDGLVNTSIGCTCEISNLIPCEESCAECKAVYMVPSDCGKLDYLPFPFEPESLSPESTPSSSSGSVGSRSATSSPPDSPSSIMI